MEIKIGQKVRFMPTFTYKGKQVDWSMADDPYVTAVISYINRRRGWVLCTWTTGVSPIKECFKLCDFQNGTVTLV